MVVLQTHRIHVKARKDHPPPFSTHYFYVCHFQPVRPDWAIYWTLGNNSKPVATIILPKLPTLLGNFCKVAKIFHFSSEIIFGQLLQTFGDFYLVTLLSTATKLEFGFFTISTNASFHFILLLPVAGADSSSCQNNQWQ